MAEWVVEWARNMIIAAVIIFGFYRGFRAGFRKKKKTEKKKS